MRRRILRIELRNLKLSPRRAQEGPEGDAQASRCRTAQTQTSDQEARDQASKETLGNGKSRARLRILEADETGEDQETKGR